MIATLWFVHAGLVVFSPVISSKPLADAAQEGVIDQKTLSHGGGIRWSGTEDPAYRTILAWINGARLEK